MSRVAFVGLIMAALMIASGYWILSDNGRDLRPATSPEEDRQEGSSASAPSPGESELSSEAGAVESPVIVPRQTEMGTDFELQDLSSVKIGEAFSFYLTLENRSIKLNVSEVRQTRAGNRVIVADSMVEGASHRLILTIGKYQTFGNLQTDRGRYQFELTGGFGAIYAASALQPKSTDADKDYVVREPRKEAPIAREEVKQ
ncbi:MAG: hypothetical protein ACI8Z1_001340 [Candidatus Azotimanducaceae bacterium]|jgi:hypothetical protein